MGLESFPKPYRVHLGCGEMKLPGFVNIDARQTKATDLVHDCGNLAIFPSESVGFVFSHAFFEHLYLAQRVPLLADIRRALHPEGYVYFCGIPDFEMVARCYLEKTRGNTRPIFDLFEAYRYTHGEPEHKPAWWLEQLHKSLFDQHDLRSQLREAGFTSPSIFRYAFRQEPNPVNLGFVARKNDEPVGDDFLKQMAEMYSPIYGKNPIIPLP
ncbi:MAG: methyltransferase domain-containing protein [Tepidisphaeraceae bacterium]|jgi:predicted SAM-dependent methyltransferase